MNAPTSLAIPDLEIETLTGDVGTVRWAVRAARTETVRSVTTVTVSARKTAELYELSSGERLLITDGTPITMRPPEAAGQLRRTPDGKLQWQSHEALEAVAGRVAAGGWEPVRTEVECSWRDCFSFRCEERDPTGAVIASGLRPPQIGALHGIASHWTIFSNAATIIMPTGTGKTETMLAALTALVRGRLLVVVPTRALRAQTVRKFLTLGLLRELGLVTPAAKNPIVGVVEHRPLQASDWDLLDPCNVIVATIGTVAQGTGAAYLDDLVAKCGVLVIDEAHHVPAETWSDLRDKFTAKRVLQFTATPFRRDGKPVDGKVVYNYPLHLAQRDGYFMPIRFQPVFEIDQDDADPSIADEAVKQLREDVGKGLDHIVMARCESKARADAVFKIYQKVAQPFAPVLLYSGAPNAAAAVDAIQTRASRVVVCVDILGEGFDLPQLKIAAVHDTHKSLAVLLQFVGRFTRTAGGTIGEATVVANIANHNLSEALERLYSEDADWNKLLSEFSSEAIKDRVALAEFLRKCERMGDAKDDPNSVPLVSPKSLFPRLSAVAYRCKGFYPDKFKDGLADSTLVPCEWVNRDARVVFFLTRTEPKVQWSNAKALNERVWDLYVLYYCQARKLLFVHSTNRESLHEQLAKAVTKGTAEIVSGDVVFRSLGRISRLMFLNIGLRRHGRRNIRFSMYTGSDVASALTPTQTGSATKANVFGSGFEGGKPANVGCSYKGRLWSRDYGTIQEFIRWCDGIAEKLTDASIQTDKIIENVLVPRQIDALPDRLVLCLDWPREMFDRSEETITLDSRYGNLPISQYGIELVAYTHGTGEVRFRVAHDTHSGTYALRLGGPMGFTVEHVEGEEFTFRYRQLKPPLDEWFPNNPPSVLFVDGSELDGCDLIEPTTKAAQAYPPQHVGAWDWTGVDIEKESMWKQGVFRADSVQNKALTEQLPEAFTVIFDDDSKGEVADLVCIREDPDAILLRLLHCKFSGDADPGRRVDDAVEVCSQAIRSSRWRWRFQELCKRLLKRETTLSKSGCGTRFRVGSAKDLNRLARVSRFKELRMEIVVVQPGLKKSALTPDQAMVLNAAHTYLMETVDLPLKVVCSP